MTDKLVAIKGMESIPPSCDMCKLYQDYVCAITNRECDCLVRCPPDGKCDPDCPEHNTAWRKPPDGLTWCDGYEINNYPSRQLTCPLVELEKVAHLDVPLTEAWVEVAS